MSVFCIVVILLLIKLSSANVTLVKGKEVSNVNSTTNIEIDLSGMIDLKQVDHKSFKKKATKGEIKWFYRNTAYQWIHPIDIQFMLEPLCDMKTIKYIG